MFLNSRESRRGVAILIASNLQYTVNQEYRDTHCNIIALNITICNVQILLVGIYGPNSNDAAFFEFLRSVFSENRHLPIVCAGDWNTTYSTEPANSNIDVLNMSNPPSLIRSGWLAELYEEFFLSDPFRALHFDKKEFSFVPKTGKKNRSRIDFFLISDRLLHLCNKCYISDALITDLFDHKSIFLSFNVTLKPKKHFVNSAIFNHPRFEAVVSTSVIETYLHHAQEEQEDVDIQEGLLHVGRLINLISRCNELDFLIAFEGNSQEKTTDLQRCSDELTMLVNTLPDPDRLNDIILNCSPDIFLEVLMGNIRNSLIGFQTWHKKVKTARANSIILNLTKLKNNYNENYNLIFSLEKELTQIRDEELSGKIRDIKLFEHLHNEKPSPLFLALIKSKVTDDLSCIKDDNGEDFTSEKDRTAYITNFFADIYREKKSNTKIDYNHCIQEFLGPEIVNNPVVQGSRITVQEREELDRPLSIQELDDSLKNCNLKSAAGADGFSNRLIKLCWHYLRIPLFNYANFCYDSGILTPNFRSACIKLIPKKGDVSKLKNWRPISLLSNMYKIISRAINARLNKVVNRICSRAQKGYNPERYVQEVLINVCETIAHCKSKNLKGAVLAVDMAKAFDSLNHDYIKAVYRFFGMGEGIIKWLNLLGHRRQACIIMGDSSFSGTFDLETGRAQGDNLSPNIFNFCEQILIFKLELDNNILCIPRPTPAQIAVEEEVYSVEVNRLTQKNESLADDNTVLTLIQRDSLLSIKTALEKFSVISGLHCNFDKTALLPIINPSVQELGWIEEAGFTVVNNLKLLGAEITVNPDDNMLNFNNIYNKIIRQVSFWSRFKLSLTGRIAIAKSFLMSQLNYLGCIFRPSDAQMTAIQQVINDFIRKNFKISDNRLYLQPERGGIGFFNLRQFLEGQRCTWLLRAHKKCIDNWRYDLCMSAPHTNPLFIRASDVNRNEHPILYDICCAYEEFYNNFCLYQLNYRASQIFENSLFRDPVTNSKITRDFFGDVFYNLYRNRIRSLRYMDCFNDLGFRTLAEFREIGLPLTFATWMRLRSCITAFRPVAATGTTTSIETFVRGWKKGGKKIRFIFQQVATLNYSYTRSRCFTTFSGLAGVLPSADYNLSPWTAFWNIHSLTNDFRTFIYSTRNNCLPFNNRLNAFLPEVDPSCTYCVLTNNLPAPRDSMSHCFLHCNSVQEFLFSTLELIGINENLEGHEFHKCFWYGESPDGANIAVKNVSYCLIFDSFRYIVFKFRKKRVLPTVGYFLEELVNFIKWTCNFNKKIKLALMSTFPRTNLAGALG
jgi:exonuclease III